MNQREMNMEIANNMEKYGGSFVKAIAECIRRADPTNLMRLREAFPEYFNEYHPSQWVKMNNKK